jgi:phosphopantothenoylcysteine synthetase/decarboxylase
MGYALAAAFLRRGDQVLLISGPTSIDLPDHADFMPVESAAEMYHAVEQSIASYDIAIFCAAVADYTIAHPETQKIKKSADTLTLELTKTKDILGSARHTFGFPGTLVGFAAETEHIEEYAQIKLQKKHCDMIVANDVSQSGIGFDSAENEIIIVNPFETIRLPRQSKENLGHLLAEIISDYHRARQESFHE